MVAHQAPPHGILRQEYLSEQPFPFPGDLPNPGIEPGSPALQADSLPSVPPEKPHYYWEPLSLGIKRELLNTVTIHCICIILIYYY